MLHLFRKIRQSLAMSDQTGKYLKYAVGEIILVVIGILIALSINNWNEQRKERLRSADYHQRLSEDVQRLIAQNDDITELAVRILNAITKSLEMMESGESLSEDDKETLDYALVWFSRTNFQTPTLPTYEEMKSNGELNLIYDVDLRNRIANFHTYLGQVESVIYKLSNAIEGHFDVFNRHLRTVVDPETLEVKYQYEFKEMAADTEFVNTFSRLSYHWRGYVYFMKRMKTEAEQLANTLTDDLLQN